MNSLNTTTVHYDTKDYKAVWLLGMELQAATPFPAFVCCNIVAESSSKCYEKMVSSIHRANNNN